MARAKVAKALPGLTHAEVLRQIEREVELAGSKALVAAKWRISPQLLSLVLNGSRHIGPKLCHALNLRRVKLTLYRYEDAGRA